ncbi:hypothetical protein [Pseudomonas putida]|uniref:hypothetical protein n=1 Tax=Pseudomonas putida TaxID=303 RepID=UPI0039AF8D41
MPLCSSITYAIRCLARWPRASNANANSPPSTCRAALPCACTSARPCPTRSTAPTAWRSSGMAAVTVALCVTRANVAMAG